MSEILPINWEQWRLADVGKWFGGGTPSSSNAAFWDGDIPWVSPKDMKVANITSAQDQITKAAVQNSAVKLISVGSVLFVTRSGILAHSFPVATTKVEVTVNQDLKAITPVEVVEHDYLAWLLRALERLILTTCSKHGTTVHSIEIPALKDLLVPIPPPAEQRRIVTTIEELFSELDKGVDSLTTVRQQLKAYRHAVLKHGFGGKLTANWRACNLGILKPATEIAQHIQYERDRAFQRQLAEWEAAVQVFTNTGKGERPSKPRPPTLPDKPSPEQTLKLWGLPDTWQWLQIGKFSFVTKLAGFEYTKFVRYDKTGDLPVIKAENAGPNGYRKTNYSRVRSASVSSLTRSHLNGGELLMVFVGAGTGNVAMVPHDQTYFLGPNIGMIRIETAIVHPRYLELFLRSPAGKDLALTSMKAVAQPSLSMGTIRQIPVAIPSPQEQQEIISRLDQLMSQIERCETDIEEHLMKASSLRQSILKKAFSGRLVAQDPNDEPASVLLERIRAEKEDSGNGRKKNIKNNGKKEAA